MLEIPCILRKSDSIQLQQLTKENVILHVPLEATTIVVDPKTAQQLVTYLQQALALPNSGGCIDE